MLMLKSGETRHKITELTRLEKTFQMKSNHYPVWVQKLIPLQDVFLENREAACCPCRMEFALLVLVHHLF